MKIKSQIFSRWGRIACVPACAGALFVTFGPDVGGWNHAIKIVAFIYMFSLGGLGALLALLTRFGVVQFIYSDSEKNTFDYKIAKGQAELELPSSFGKRSSPHYYQSFDLDKNNPSPPDSSENPLEKFRIILSKIIGISFILGGVIFLAAGCVLLFLHGKNTKLIGGVFVAGSVLNIILGVVVIKFFPKFMSGRFSPDKRQDGLDRTTR
jgi:hypothetical protein